MAEVRKPSSKSQEKGSWLQRHGLARGEVARRAQEHYKGENLRSEDVSPELRSNTEGYYKDEVGNARKRTIVFGIAGMLVGGLITTAAIKKAQESDVGNRPATATEAPQISVDRSLHAPVKPDIAVSPEESAKSNRAIETFMQAMGPQVLTWYSTTDFTQNSLTDVGQNENEVSVPF